jgi:AraC family transcriptional regulator, transcriptional activator FtrA
MTPASVSLALPDSGIIDCMRAKAATTAGQPHAVALVVYDGVALFELGVACDVFGDDHGGDPLYSLAICAAEPKVRTDAGVTMQIPQGLAAVSRARTVIVPPTERLEQVPASVLDVLRAARSAGKRLMSLCTGAWIVAAAGILDGHTATTHWSECADLARRYPRVRVDPKVLYVDEGDLLTSAGSAASIDLCLHVVQRDYGAEVAARFARDLVVPLHRDGGQAQYIEAPLPAPGADDLFADTIGWLRGNLAQDISVAALADRSAMSARTFARRFVASTGTTPYAWIARERVRLAQRLLETTDLPVEVIARDCGLGSAANLRKHFTRALATSPRAYRRTFAASAG